MKILTPDEIRAENLIEIGKRIFASTPPLYIHGATGKPKLASSSILVKWRTHHFLVTAGHTLRQFKPNELGFIFQRKYQTFSGKFITTRTDKIENDKIDIGIIALEDYVLKQLSPDFVFYDLESFDADHADSSEDDYLLVGHPISRTKIRMDKNKIMLAPFLLQTKLIHDKKIYEQTRTKSNANFLLHYRRRKIKDTLNNSVIQGPKPEGLSGCGVWRVSNPVTHDIDSIQYFPTGIIIEYYHEYNVLIGTRMRLIMECLRQAFDVPIPLSKIAKVNLHYPQAPGEW